MKKLLYFQLMLFIVLFSFNQLFAQPGRGINRGNITRLYDSATVETITGEITKIEIAEPGYGRFPGTIITLKNKAQELKVYVAPDWYLGQEKIQFKNGDSLTVIGSLITYENQPLIILKETTCNGKKIVIRNDNGVPVWAGKRLGPGQGRRARR